jgi:protein dithiol oxidoreductase (disulfide-forming)
VTKHRASAFIAALLAAGWIASAGARAPGPAASVSVVNLAALAQWKAGTNYQLLAAPQPTSVPKGKIEVNEIFWYGCGHCYALDPALESWKAEKPDYVEFVRIPVVWGQAHRQHAKLYYTLQALRRPDLHPKIFEAIHRNGLTLAARDDLEARAQHLAFMTAQGVAEKDFNAAYDSMSVASNVLKAESLTQKYAVENVPVMIVNGKYSTSVSEAGGTSQLLSLINDLAASEKNR